MANGFIYFSAFLTFISIFSGCQIQKSQKEIDFEINFEGKNYICNLKEEHGIYHFLECTSLDSFRLLLGYVGNRKQGPLHIYFPNDSLYIEGMFVDDKRDGIWKEYADNGDLESFSYIIQDTVFYSKSFSLPGQKFIGQMPVEMKVERLVDSTELEFVLAYSNLDTFYTGGVFTYRLDENRRIEYTKVSKTNALKLKIPKSYSGEIKIEFMELDTTYGFMGAEKFRVIVDSSHSDVVLLDNVLSKEENIKLFREHSRKLKKPSPN